MKDRLYLTYQLQAQVVTKMGNISKVGVQLVHVMALNKGKGEVMSQRGVGYERGPLMWKGCYWSILAANTCLKISGIQQIIALTVNISGYMCSSFN